MIMFGEAPSWLGGAEYELKISVKDIAGIDDGTPVYLNGIKIGRVTELTFVNDQAPEKGVVVLAKIKKQFAVPTGSRAELVAPALGLGRGRVNIFAEGGGMKPVEPGGVIHGNMVNALQDIIPETMLGSLESTTIKIGDFAEKLTPVATDLHEILKITPLAKVDSSAGGPQPVQPNMYTVVQRLDRVLKNLDDIFGDPELKDGLRGAIDNVIAMSTDGKATFQDLRDTSANLKVDASRIADKLEHSIDNMTEKVDTIADAAMPILDSTAKAATNMEAITNDLRQGKGTLGKLLTDPRLYEVLVLSIERATDLFDSARRLFYRFEKTGRVGIGRQWPTGE